MLIKGDETLIALIKLKTNTLYSKCPSWSHSNEQCEFKKDLSCQKSKGEHLNDFCSDHKLFVCPVKKSGESLMCPQDVRPGDELTIICVCLMVEVSPLL